MNKLSLTMIVKNESRCLSRCLDSVRDIVSEIIIVDTGSTDNTKEIAKKYNCSIYNFDWEEDFSSARNYAIEKSTGDWNLILDADEYISNDCKETIMNFINNPSNQNKVAQVKIVSNFLEDNQEKESQSFISRIAPKYTKFSGKIHEQLGVDLKRERINVEIKHDGYFFIDKSNRNLDLLLSSVKKNPKNCYLLYQTAKTYNIAKKFNEADTFFKKCYKTIDKNAGYRYSLINDYLYNIIHMKKFKEGLSLINEEKEFLSDNPDFHFACGLFYMELVMSDISKYINFFKNIELEYLTCLNLGETKKYDSVLGTGSFMAAYNLGVFYETTGDIIKAKKYYKISSNDNYSPAINRLQTM